MPDYTPFKQGFIFCFMIFAAIWAVGHFGGCEGAPTSTKTEFSTPTSQPSVSPAIKTVSDDEGDLQGDVNDAGPMVDELTQMNLPDKKPPLQKKVKSIQDKTKKLGDDLVTAKEKSDENDAAGVAIAKERDDARELVGTREAQMAQQKIDDDKKIAAANADKDRLVLLFNFGVIGAGIVLGIVGVVIAVKSSGSIGFIILGSGIAVIAAGYAGIYFGWQIGLCALVAGAATIIIGIWYLIHTIMADGQTTIQAIQQAKIAGVIPTESWPVLKQMFDSIQTPGAKAMVAAETK